MINKRRTKNASLVLHPLESCEKAHINFRISRSHTCCYCRLLLVLQLQLKLLFESLVCSRPVFVGEID